MAQTFTLSDCGIMVEPQLGMSMDQLVQSAKLSEDLGFGYFFRSDHILPTDDRRGIDSPECWTSLGAVAASTTRVKFGPLVTPVGFRNPALLAKMACTLHSYSKGRLQLAVGAGWYEAEYRAHGFTFPDFRARVAQFGEALEIMTDMMGKGRVDYDGKYFSAHTDCLPRPSGHVHLIVGGRTKPVVKLAAKYADEWNYFRMASVELGGLKSILDASANGREVDVTEMGPYLIGKNEADLESYAKMQIAKLGQGITPRELFARLRARDAPCGTVDEFAEQLESKSRSGVKRVYFQTLVPENTEMVELLAETIKRS